MSIAVAPAESTIRGAITAVDANGPTGAALEHAQHLQANHLEDGEEGDDEIATLRHIVEQFLEAEGFHTGQTRHQLLDAHLERHLFHRQVGHRPPAAGAAPIAAALAPPSQSPRAAFSPPRN